MENETDTTVPADVQPVASTPAPAAPSQSSEDVAAIKAELAAVRAELQETLTKNQDTIKDARDRVLAMKQREWDAQFNTARSEWTTKETKLTSRLHQLEIENTVRAGGVQWRADAVDVVLELVNKVAKINPATGEVELSGAHSGKTLTEYLEALAAEKPFLVQSRLKGGVGDMNSKGTSQSDGSGVTQLPSNWDTMNVHEQGKFLLANPELRKRLKENRN